MKRFDLIHTPLEGTNLIEASAGTGKTYTLASLYVRLVLEKGFSTDQILVVTFTKAATEELQNRVRRKLIHAKKALTSGYSDDTLLKNLIEKQTNPEAAIQLIQDALVDFDKAAIFTIHSFCQRVMHENAFETGSLFDTELVADQVGLTQEVADDFWRTHLYESPPEFISYITRRISGPEYFLKLLTRIKAPAMKIVPDIGRPSIENLKPFRKCLNKLKKAWPDSRDRVKELLLDPSLSGVAYGSLKTEEMQTGLSKREVKVLSMLESMDRFADAKSTGFPLFKGFEKFTLTKLNQSVKKGNVFSPHDIFEICEQLQTLGSALESEMEKTILFFKSELFDFADRELSARKQKWNVQFFDDLLLTVQNALSDQRKNALSEAIRQKYKAALVDEFQDTDPIQYDIFHRLFDSKDSVLFMIGDPKQAIYSFRGADIFSYMEASRNVENKQTLSENWRSSSGLITAVNTLFSNLEAPFIFDEIHYEKGRPGKITEISQKEPDPPFRLWYLNAKGDKSIPKAEAVQRIAESVANEISNLVSPLEGRIKPGSIAVLVRTNRQARIIKDHLSEKFIPSVLYNAGNIFHTREASQIQRVLLSISEPGNEKRFKSALVTEMLGVLGDTIDGLDQESHWWENRISNFREYHRIWHRRGFIRMFRLLLEKEKVKPRLLSFPDGERRLTNLLQLSEIFHKESTEKKLGVSGLIKWLSEQMNSSSQGAEEHQLRLESDADAVKIITIHKSKGLEYPVVFCPYGWAGSVVNADEIVFHDTDERRTLTLDIGSGKNSSHLALAQNELLSENLRLLYVALTRAKTRCYLAWGHINTAETSAMAYLLHAKTRHKNADKRYDWKRDDIVSSLKKVFSKKTNDEILSDLEKLVIESDGTIALDHLPIESGGEYQIRPRKDEKYFCRNFSGEIDKTWQISSYSSLVSRRSETVEQPDRDAHREPYRQKLSSPADHIDHADLSDEIDIFSFPKGTRAGLFFHDVFERLDFTSEDSSHREQLVADRLKTYGFSESWNKTVCSTIQHVISTPLLRGRGDLVLSSIGSSDRINEMEFYFPIKSITPYKLKNIFSDFGSVDIPSDFSQRLEDLSFSPSEGFMKGYIDMIFRSKDCYYLVDWKSNFLGARIKDYGKKVLENTMRNDFYILQYYLYTLALHLYLRSRVADYRYETHFGGVFYVFIRGVDTHRGSDYGIYTDLPSPRLIEALEESLIHFPG
ncbi:exodeoxyribonuclease V subunit beta [Thermodesulfobacteriota bacterium]